VPRSAWGWLASCSFLLSPHSGRRGPSSTRPRLPPLALSLTGLGALGINLFCAFLLARHRQRGGSLTRAAFLSARNDALANLAIIAAGLVTASVWASAWPDLLVGLGIAVLNADAAREVWTAARAEHVAAKA
jgi:Co/Zn/Cd efflux system component